MADFSEITDGTIGGTGSFDQTMQALNLHLAEQFSKGRLTGANFASVYSTGIQTAMQQAIQWHLGADTAENQALLIAAQIRKVEADILLTEAQIAKIEAETLLIPKQGELMDQQILTAQSQAELTAQQVLTEVQNTASATFNVTTMLPAQAILLDQKLITEEAQTKSITSQGVVEGILGKQMALYAKQTDGYTRDAEQKAARLITDTWGIGITSDALNLPLEADVNSIDEVLRGLRLGAGLDDDFLP